MPSPLMVPAKTVAPSSLVIGFDSPVNIDSLTVLLPETMLPSVGILSPASTVTTSPFLSFFAATCSPDANRAIAGINFSRLALAAAACLLARISRKRPKRRKKVNMAMDSKKTSPVSITVAYKLAK